MVIIGRMATTVGSAQVTFEADTSSISDELVQALDTAMDPINQILRQMGTSVESTADQADSALAGGISDGAALAGVDGNGMAAAQQAASQAGADVASELLDGSAQADSPLADQYHPLAMGPVLVRAHDKLVRKVDRAFGASRKLSTEEQRLELFFTRYSEMTREQRKPAHDGAIGQPCRSVLGR